MTKPLLLVALIISLLYAYLRLNDGFSLSRIQMELPFSQRWEVKEPPLEEIDHLVNQPFYYLGKGSQCFVFESEDKQVVLKFFRLSRYQLPKITRYFTFPTFLCAAQQKKREKKERKLEALFESCKLAYEELPEETALLYLHLNKTKHLRKQVIIHNPLKQALSLNLDDYSFVLQKQGEQIFPYLNRLIEKGKKQETKKALDQLVLLLRRRLEKGISDHDPVLQKNSGFQNHLPFFTDIGAFEKRDQIDISYELFDATRALHAWLENKESDLAIYLDQAIRA